MPGADTEMYLPTAGESVCTGQCGVFAFCNCCPVCRAQTVSPTTSLESTLQGNTVLSQIQCSERVTEIWGLLDGEVVVEDISCCRFIWLRGLVGLHGSMQRGTSTGGYRNQLCCLLQSLQMPQCLAGAAAAPVC